MSSGKIITPPNTTFRQVTKKMTKIGGTPMPYIVETDLVDMPALFTRSPAGQVGLDVNAITTFLQQHTAKINALIRENIDLRRKVAILNEEPDPELAIAQELKDAEKLLD